jgi:hypothetical protein
MQGDLTDCSDGLSDWSDVDVDIMTPDCSEFLIGGDADAEKPVPTTDCSKDVHEAIGGVKADGTEFSVVKKEAGADARLNMLESSCDLFFSSEAGRKMISDVMDFHAGITKGEY